MSLAKGGGPIILCTTTVFSKLGSKQRAVATLASPGVGRGENDQQVGERDGIAIAGEPGIAITAIESAEIILVDTA